MTGNCKIFCARPQPIVCSDYEVIKWLSCNGVAWGLGPTAVFACAAAVFLYREIDVTLPLSLRGESPYLAVVYLESALMATMVLGMLALMIHLWVGCTRFLQFYMETIIHNYPMAWIEAATFGMLGGGKPGSCHPEPLTHFLSYQQPLLHVTLCWFLALCYADYVRRNYCDNFEIPYIEEWQANIQSTTMESLNRTMRQVKSFVSRMGERILHMTNEVYGHMENQETVEPGRPEER